MLKQHGPEIFLSILIMRKISANVKRYRKENCKFLVKSEEKRGAPRSLSMHQGTGGHAAASRNRRTEFAA